MKKLFTFIVALFATVCLHAQVNVVDAGGNVCPDGGVMDFYDEMPDFPTMVMFGSPMLVNTSDAKVRVSMDVTISQLPEGTALSDCFSGMCTNYKEVGAHKTATKEIEPMGTMPTLVEWDCFDAKTNVNVEGVCIVDFTLYVNDQKSQTFTARYVNGDVTLVKGISVNAAQKQGTFSLDGKRLQNEAKGLVVRNGKKVVVK